jgi:hypothetical protein
MMPTSLICNDPIQMVSNQGGPGAANYLVDGVYVSLAMPYCPSGWIEVAQVIPFDSSQIDPTVVTALIGAGFLLYLTPWAAAYGFSSLLKMLR